jgi:hypothetical protein
VNTTDEKELDMWKMEELELDNEPSRYTPKPKEAFMWGYTDGDSSVWYGPIICIDPPLSYERTSKFLAAGIDDKCEFVFFETDDNVRYKQVSARLTITCE